MSGKTKSSDRKPFYKELNEDGKTIVKENLNFKFFRRAKLSDWTDAFQWLTLNK